MIAITTVVIGIAAVERQGRTQAND
jgi:hypothetical protein